MKKKSIFFCSTQFLIFVLFSLQASAQSVILGDNNSTPSAEHDIRIDSESVFKTNKLAIEDVDVLIIESRSFTAGHVMDTVWAFVARNLNLSYHIGNQATLDSLGSVSIETILIISSGIGSLSESRADSILAFVQRGGNVYLQNEYLPSYQTNLAFRYLVDTLGGEYEIGETVSGSLVPMIVSGDLQSNYNIVEPLNHFHYGCTGIAGSNVEPFLTFNGQHFGFIFTPPNIQYGKIIANSDQDWVRVIANVDLMANIIQYLRGVVSSIDYNVPGSNIGFSLIQNYPNPFNPITTISYILPGSASVTFTVYNIVGQKLASITKSFQNAGLNKIIFNASSLSSGVYIYRVETSTGFSQSRKMLLLK